MAEKHPLRLLTFWIYCYIYFVCKYFLLAMLFICSKNSMNLIWSCAAHAAFADRQSFPISLPVIPNILAAWDKKFVITITKSDWGSSFIIMSFKSSTWADICAGTSHPLFTCKTSFQNTNAMIIYKTGRCNQVVLYPQSKWKFTGALIPLVNENVHPNPALLLCMLLLSILYHNILLLFTYIISRELAPIWTRYNDRTIS